MPSLRRDPVARRGAWRWRGATLYLLHLSLCPSVAAPKEEEEEKNPPNMNDNKHNTLRGRKNPEWISENQLGEASTPQLHREQ